MNILIHTFGDFIINCKIVCNKTNFQVITYTCKKRERENKMTYITIIQDKKKNKLSIESNLDLKH